MDSQSKKRLKIYRGLTVEAFEKLLLSFDEDQEKASLIYEDIRKRLIRQFNANQSLIAEEQADEVFNRVARKISEEDFVLERENPYSYFHQIARYILLEYQRQNRRKILHDELSYELKSKGEKSYDKSQVEFNIKNLTDKKVLLLANLQLAESQQETLHELLEKNSEGKLTKLERKYLDDLMEVYNAALLTKAKAMRIAVERGLMPPLSSE